MSYNIIFKIFLYPSQPEQQQSNVVVVDQPTQPTVISKTYTSSEIGAPALICAVIASICAFSCCWWALFLSIPALVYARNVSIKLLL